MDPVQQVVNLNDFEALAKDVLPKAVFDWIAGGAEDEITLRRNRAIFEKWAFIPRVLIDVSAIDTSTTVLGTRIPIPVMVAPASAVISAEFDKPIASGAAEFGTIYTLTSMSQMTMKEACEAYREGLTKTADGLLWWFQVYIHRNRKITEYFVRCAESLGAKALVLTVDVPKLGKRDRNFRNRFTLAKVRYPNFNIDPASLPTDPTDFHTPLVLKPQFDGADMDSRVTWEDVSWLRSLTRLPVVIKGIMHPDDALRAAAAGAAAIVVSNHGGRQLDGALSTLEALDRISRVLTQQINRNDFEVYVDGGFRRGSDVVKALALGARAVWIGRPTVYAAAVDGRRGVVRALEILREEVETTMALLGTTSIANVKRECVVKTACL